MAKTLQDLVNSRATITAENLQSVAKENPPLYNVTTDFENRLVAAMPGDDIAKHPLNTSADTGKDNPFMSKNPLAILRALKAGSMPEHERRQALEYLKLYQKLTGDLTTSSTDDER